MGKFLYNPQWSNNLSDEFVLKVTFTLSFSSTHSADTLQSTRSNSLYEWDESVDLLSSSLTTSSTNFSSTGFTSSFGASSTTFSSTGFSSSFGASSTTFSSTGFSFYIFY